MKTLVMLALVALIGTAAVGCRAGGEIDVDEQAQIVQPR